MIIKKSSSTTEVQQLIFLLLLLCCGLLNLTTTISGVDGAFQQQQLQAVDNGMSSSRRRRGFVVGRQQHNMFPSSMITTTSTIRRMSNDDECGEGFIKQTGPDGDYCVFDYDAVSSKFGTDKEHHVPDPEHYWEGLEAKNKARKKFGLKPLTPEEYVALQIQSEAISDQLVIDAIATSFEKFDANSDGVITFEEFKQGLKASLIHRKDISEPVLRNVFDIMDTSGDGLLQIDEFLTVDKIRSKLETAIVVENEQQQQQSENNNALQNFLQDLKESTMSHFDNQDDRCETNDDCYHPEVCCDFGFTKRCCRSGRIAKEMQHQYAMVPVPQGYTL